MSTSDDGNRDTQVARWLRDAVARHQAGDLATAERLYRQVLTLAPQHPVALNLLGTVAAQLGHAEAAVALIRQAIAARPDYAEAFNNLGHALANLGQGDEARTAYQRAIELKPDFAEAHNNLGHTLWKQRELAAAEAACRRALECRPGYAAAWNNLGNVLDDAGQSHAALAAYEESLAARPDFATARDNLIQLLRRQVAQSLGKNDQVIAFLRRLADLQPNEPQVFAALATELKRLSRADDALACLREAMARFPDQAELQGALGNLLYDCGQLGPAVDELGQTLKLRPDWHQHRITRAVALRDLGLFDDALDELATVLRADPDEPAALLNAGITHLTREEWAPGWAGYRHRFRVPRFAIHVARASQPEWNGEPSPEQTILLLAEQGLGDTIQFLRYVPLVRRHFRRVVVAVQRPLLSLVARVPGIDQLVALDDPWPAHDCYCPLLTLPHWFSRSEADIPRTVPYLSVSSETRARWIEYFSRTPRPHWRIGIAWQGNPQYPRDAHRSLPLREFAPLAELPGVELISLQKGPGEDQLAPFSGRWPIHELPPDRDTAAGAFEDTAAILEHLDVLVASDSAIVHLAGALARPVWVPIGYLPDWRWLLERTDSPWYPTMRLFRQSQPGEWRSVFQRIADELAEVGPEGVAASAAAAGAASRDDASTTRRKLKS